MTLSNLLSALTKRNASEASLRAVSEIQICVDGNWRAQTANITDAALDEMIAKALPLDEETAWRTPNGRTNFQAQGYNVEASKESGAITIKLKQLTKANSKPLNAQAAGELKNSAFANSVAFAPVAQPTPPAPPPTAATSPASLPKLPLVTPTNSVPPPMPSTVGDWHYCDTNGLQRGPLSLVQIRSLINMTTIGAQTLVWKEGMSDWLPVAQTELGQFLPQNHAPDSYGAPPLSPPSFDVRPSNGSGTKGAPLPDELVGFNWGAMFSPLLWCAYHGLLWMSGAAVAGLVISSIILLIANRIIFLSIFDGGVAIRADEVAIGIAITTSLSLFAAWSLYMGFTGSKLAWQNRAWTDIEEFKTVQLLWGKRGVVGYLMFMGCLLFLIFACVVDFSFYLGSI